MNSNNQNPMNVIISENNFYSNQGNNQQSSASIIRQIEAVAPLENKLDDSYANQLNYY